ncbi:MAG: TrkA C-terminal domain-containing protein [Candidatus Xenobiia bacterium LiM19]
MASISFARIRSGVFHIASSCAEVPGASSPAHTGAGFNDCRDNVEKISPMRTASRNDRTTAKRLIRTICIALSVFEHCDEESCLSQGLSSSDICREAMSACPQQCRSDRKENNGVKIREKTGCTIVAIDQDHNILHPGPELVIDNGHHMILIGTIESERSFMKSFG